MLEAAVRSPLSALRSPLLAVLGITLVGVITARAQAPGRGPAVDPFAFAYSRTIPSGPEALVELTLDAAVQAHSRGPEGEFADVRIVDAANRQIQYLLQPRRSADFQLPPSLSFSVLTAPPAALASTPGHTRTTYSVDAPYIGGALMVFTSEAGTFTRIVQVGVERAADRSHRERWVEVLDRREWTCCNDVPLELSLGTHVGRGPLLLTLDEGDNPPLRITAVRGFIPAWQARFYRPADESLRLLYGNPRLVAPRYDLALLRAQITSAKALPLQPGPEVVMQKKPAAIVSPRVFWGFLIAAVLVLLGLIARLATSRTSGDPPPPSAPAP